MKSENSYLHIVVLFNGLAAHRSLSMNEILKIEFS